MENASSASRGDKEDVMKSVESDSLAMPTSSEESWGHRAIILLRDLMCVRKLLHQESMTENTENTGNTGLDLAELSNHLFHILDEGHRYVLPDAENKPPSFLKGQDLFLADAQSSTDETSSYSHSLEFVSAAVQEFFQDVIDEKGTEESRESEKKYEIVQIAKTNRSDGVGGDAPGVTPHSNDIQMITRKESISNANPGLNSSGNERMLSLVDQYVSTNNEKDLLSVLSANKRAQAAIAIVDLAKETDAFKRGEEITKTLGRYLVSRPKSPERSWVEVSRVDAAEVSVILLFEKFLERERAPWGIHHKASSQNVPGEFEPSEDFSKPGTAPIATPASHDVLFGRGGMTNNHPGNRRFRDIISLHRPDYIHAVKVEKPNVARRIVKAIRAGNPSGRFLKKNEKDGMWYDTGDRHAAEKTSQALREKIKNRPSVSKLKRDQDPSESIALLANSPSSRVESEEQNSSLPSSLAAGVANMQGLASYTGSLSSSQFGPYSMALRAEKKSDSSTQKPKESSDSENATAASAGIGDSQVTESGEKAGDKEMGDAEKEPYNPVDESGNILVTDHDILCGRGGMTNAHRGNKRFRDIVSLHRADYVRAPKVLKPNVARLIVRAIRNGDPPGRFLRKDDKTGLWMDIGDKRAAEKASQALREKTSNNKPGRLPDVPHLLAPRPDQDPMFALSAHLNIPVAATQESTSVGNEKKEKGDDKTASQSESKGDSSKASVTDAAETDGNAEDTGNKSDALAEEREASSEDKDAKAVSPQKTSAITAEV